MGRFTRSHRELGIMEDEEEEMCASCTEFVRLIVLFLQAVVLVRSYEYYKLYRICQTYCPIPTGSSSGKIIRIL